MSLANGINLVIILIATLLIGSLVRWVFSTASFQKGQFKSTGNLKEDVEKLSNPGSSYYYKGHYDLVSLLQYLGEKQDLKIVSKFFSSTNGEVDTEVFVLESGGNHLTLGVKVVNMLSDDLEGGTEYGLDGKVQVVTDLYWVIPSKGGFELKKKALLEAISGSSIKVKGAGSSDGGYITLTPVGNSYQAKSVETIYYHNTLNPGRIVDLRTGMPIISMPISKAIMEISNLLTSKDTNFLIQGRSGTGKSILAMLIADTIASRNVTVVTFTSEDFRKYLLGEISLPQTENRKLVFVDEIGNIHTDPTLVSCFNSILDGSSRKLVKDVSFLFVATPEVTQGLPPECLRRGRLHSYVELKMCDLKEIEEMDNVVKMATEFKINIPEIKAYMAYHKVDKISYSEVWGFLIPADEVITEIPELKRESSKAPKLPKPKQQPKVQPKKPLLKFNDDSRLF